LISIAGGASRTHERLEAEQADIGFAKSIQSHCNGLIPPNMLERVLKICWKTVEASLNRWMQRWILPRYSELRGLLKDSDHRHTLDRLWQWEGVLHSIELPKIWGFLAQLEVHYEAFDMETVALPNEILLPRNHIVRNADIHQYDPEIVTPEVLEALVDNSMETCLRLKDKGPAEELRNPAKEVI